MKLKQLMSTLGAPVAGLTLLLTAVPAAAQDGFVSGVAGLGLSYGPSFLGSDESETGVIPIFDLKIGSYGFFNQRGLGLQNAVELGAGTLRYGAGIGYDFEERIAADDARLTGLPDVEAGTSANAFVEYETGPLAFGLDLQKGLSSDGPEGLRAKLYGSYGTQLNERTRLSVSPYVIWADDDWMDAYFTVTPGQAATSGLAAFDASSGLAQGGVTFTGSYAVSARAVFFASLDFSTLAGDAKDSSLSFDDTQTSLSTGIMFRF